MHHQFSLHALSFPLALTVLHRPSRVTLDTPGGQASRAEHSCLTRRRLEARELRYSDRVMDNHAVSMREIAEVLELPDHPLHRLTFNNSDLPNLPDPEYCIADAYYCLTNMLI